MIDENLICVCNDNANCFYNHTLNIIFGLPREVGFCIAVKRGYCYKSFYESTKRQRISKNRHRISTVYPKISMGVDEMHKKAVHKYGCLHFSPFILLMCNGDNSDNQTNKFFSCCKNRNACNVDLNMSESARSIALSPMRRSENSHDRISYKHGMDTSGHVNQEITASFGPEILIRKGSNSIPNDFQEISDSNSVHNHLNGLQILSIFVPAAIMIGIIAIFLLTKCTVSNSFSKKRSEWTFCITSTQLKVAINPSSAASTRSTNLQDSQSFSSSQITRSKVQHGKMLIHKLENLKFQSKNQHSDNFTG